MGKLIVPIYSMRSYTKDAYSILKDGNFQLQLHRASKDDVICIPENSLDIEELIRLFPDYTFAPLQYGYNVVNTRNCFWSWNSLAVRSLMRLHQLDKLVIDIPGYRGNYPFIYNCNVIKGERDVEIETAKRAEKVFVLNQHQANWFRSKDIDSSKIVVCTKVINDEIMKRYIKLVVAGGLIDLKHTQKQVFHPFRISDKCYKIDDVIRYCNDTGSELLITDPNDTWKDKEDYFKCHYPDVKVTVQKMNKLEYYAKLMTSPVMVYLEDPEETFHPGLAELIYFDARIIGDKVIPGIEDVLIEGDVWQS